MQLITPHYTSLGLLKFTDIVNVCFFMIISTMKSFLIYLFH